jgi:hypothetical protein
MYEGGLRRRMTVMTTTVTTLLRRLAGPVQSLPEAGTTDLVLRFAGPADAAAIDRLAQLDSRRAPRGAVLLAEVDGSSWAALSIDDGHAVSDPFRPTGELVALLLERARQIKRARTHRKIERVWPKAGYDHPAWS